MKILITGSAGFLGKNLFNALKKSYEVYGIDRNESEQTTFKTELNSDDLKQILNKINPAIIIHCAALTNVDFCEENSEEAEKANVKSTENLVNWAKQNHKKIIFISTDYVYSGETGDYNEDSETNPINVYGKTKLKSENLVSSLENYVILRTSTIFGYDPGRNFLMQLLNLKEKRKIPADQISNPTDVKVLVDYIEKIIENNITGLFIATGQEPMSRKEFTLLISEVFNLNKDLFEFVLTKELKQIAKRPLNNSVNSEKLRKLLSYSCPNVKQSLINIKQKNRI